MEMTDAKGFIQDCDCSLTMVVIDGLEGVDQVWCEKHGGKPIPLPETN